MRGAQVAEFIVIAGIGWNPYFCRKQVECVEKITCLEEWGN